jgi:hypothetical protein
MPDATPRELGVSVIKTGQCQCGADYFIMADRKVAQALLGSLGADAAATELAIHLQIFVCEDKVGVCSVCKAEISLPVSELLDPLRCLMGSWCHASFEGE